MNTHTTCRKEGEGEAHARSVLAAIVNLVRGLRSGDETESEEYAEKITAAKPAILLRAGWYMPGRRHLARAEDYQVLLSQGVRVAGTLSITCEPDSARLEYINCGQAGWVGLYPVSMEEVHALLTYAQQFHYGEDRL